MSGITLLHCRTGAQGLDTELGIFCAPSTSGLSYSSYLHSRLVFNARCNASSFWWFFSACIMRCSRRGIYYQGGGIHVWHMPAQLTFPVMTRLARTVYIHRIWPYIWWFPCQKYRIYAVYIWFWPTLAMTLVLCTMHSWALPFPSYLSHFTPL
jgi:hypothetical protein